MGLKSLFERLTGIDKIKANAVKEAEAAVKVAREASEAAIEAERVRKEAEEAAEIAKLSAKDRATRLKEPWVGVLNTHVNKENVRNGFFELDWNEYFVLQLKQDGYGVDGDKDEEIVDRWFRELCANVVVDGDYGGPVESGIVINKLKE